MSQLPKYSQYRNTDEHHIVPPHLVKDNQQEPLSQRYSQSNSKEETAKSISWHKLPNLIKCLIADWQAIFKNDPAARNPLEVLFCYPGLHALWVHRFTHQLYRWKIPFIPRFISFISRLITGIEIHPGAKIGQGVFIDHGMGVVIGETAIIGDNCVIYQGVTLGGTGKETGKRHPTLASHVMVGAGAKILGNILIGDHVRIGASSVVLKNVPSHSTVVGVPGRVLRHYEKITDIRDVNHPHQQNLPDLEAEVIKSIYQRIKILEQEVASLSYPSAFAHYVANKDETIKRLLENPFTSNSLEQDFVETTAASDQIIKDFLDGSGI
jgi:serine O-acetyltransferase